MRVTVLDGQEGQDPSHAAPHRTSTARPSPAARDGGGGGGATCTHAPALHSATRTFVTRAQATDLSSAPSRARRTPALARRASLPADSHAYHVGVDMRPHAAQPWAPRSLHHCSRMPEETLPHSRCTGQPAACWADPDRQPAAKMHVRWYAGGGRRPEPCLGVTRLWRGWASGSCNVTTPALVSRGDGLYRAADQAAIGSLARGPRHWRRRRRLWERIITIDPASVLGRIALHCNRSRALLDRSECSPAAPQLVPTVYPACVLASLLEAWRHDLLHWSRRQLRRQSAHDGPVPRRWPWRPAGSRPTNRSSEGAMCASQPPARPAGPLAWRWRQRRQGRRRRRRRRSRRCSPSCAGQSPTVRDQEQEMHSGRHVVDWALLEGQRSPTLACIPAPTDALRCLPAGHCCCCCCCCRGGGRGHCRQQACAV